MNCQVCTHEIEKERIERLQAMGIRPRFCKACNARKMEMRAKGNANRIKTATERRRITRQVHDQMMRDLGMTKVRGAVSGRTYWE